MNQEVKFLTVDENLNSPSRMRFDELCRVFLEKHAAFKRSGERDERTIRTRLLPYFKDLQLAAFTQRIITDYKAERAKVVRPATVNRELALLKTMFNKRLPGVLWTVTQSAGSSSSRKTIRSNGYLRRRRKSGF